MRRALALLTLAAALPCSAAVEWFELDPDHSFVHFEVLHFGTATIRGRLGPVAGTIELDRAAGRGRVGVAIDMTTVSTGLRSSTADCARTTCWPPATIRWPGSSPIDGSSTVAGCTSCAAS
jgi:polyisoprenoid-binding protein YceI